MANVHFEDITENMEGNPEVERWTSVIEGMQCYRVWQDENNIIVYSVGEDGKEQQVNDAVQEHVLELMEGYDGR